MGIHTTASIKTSFEKAKECYLQKKETFTKANGKKIKCTEKAPTSTKKPKTPISAIGMKEKEKAKAGYCMRRSKKCMMAIGSRINGKGKEESIKEMEKFGLGSLGMISKKEKCFWRSNCINMKYRGFLRIL